MGLLNLMVQTLFFMCSSSGLASMISMIMNSVDWWGEVRWWCLSVGPPASLISGLLCSPDRRRRCVLFNRSHRFCTNKKTDIRYPPLGGYYDGFYLIFLSAPLNAPHFSNSKTHSRPWRWCYVRYYVLYATPQIHSRREIIPVAAGKHHDLTYPSFSAYYLISKLPKNEYVLLTLNLAYDDFL